MVLAVLAARRWVSRILLGLGTLVLVLVSVAAAINAHFDYYPQLADLFGSRGADAAPDSALARTTKPDRGIVVALSIPGEKSEFDARPAQVYVPPAWFGRHHPQLPVIMLLHGTPGSPEDWTVAGNAQGTADAWASQHGGQGAIIVMPDINGSFLGDTECVNSPRGNAETYLTVDVPAWTQRNFNTRPPGRDWAIAGLSEGGKCSLMLSLRHPDMFFSFGNFSGLEGPRVGDSDQLGDTVSVLFGGSQAAFDAYEPEVLLTSKRYPNLAGWFQVGTADAGPFQAANTLVPLAKGAGIETCYTQIPGGQHVWQVWAPAFADTYPWFASRFGLDDGPTSCPAGS